MGRRLGFDAFISNNRAQTTMVNTVLEPKCGGKDKAFKLFILGKSKIIHPWDPQTVLL